MKDTSIAIAGLPVSPLPSRPLFAIWQTQTTHRSYLSNSDVAAIKSTSLKERYTLSGMTKTNEFGLVSQFYSEPDILHSISVTVNK